MSGGVSLEYPEAGEWREIDPCDSEYKNIVENFMEEYDTTIINHTDGELVNEVADFFENYLSKSYVMKASVAAGYAADNVAENHHHKKELAQRLFQGTNKYVLGGPDSLGSSSRQLAGEGVKVTQEELHGGLRLGYHLNGTDIHDLDVDSKDDLRVAENGSPRVGTVDVDPGSRVRKFVSSITEKL